MKIRSEDNVDEQCLTRTSDKQERVISYNPLFSRIFRNCIFRKMHFSKMHFSKFFQIFGGLVLGCIKTKFCKKICVRQHFSSSTRFASFCTAAISKFSQKIGLKNQHFVKFQHKNCKCRKICKILPNFKNFSLIIW